LASSLVSSLTYVCPCLFFFRIDIDQPITVLASSRVKAAYQIAQNNNTSFQMSPLIDIELTDEDSPTNSPKAGSESKEESESEPEEEAKGSEQYKYVSEARISTYKLTPPECESVTRLCSVSWVVT